MNSLLCMKLQTIPFSIHDEGEKKLFMWTKSGQNVRDKTCEVKDFVYCKLDQHK